MAVRQVSIFLENETGRLADLTQILADNGIDLNAVTIAETGEYGILRCIVQNPEEAVAALAGKGFMASISDVLTVAIDNVPGAVNKVLQLLADAGIGVKYIYSTIQSAKGEAAITMKTTDQQRAENILLKAGVRLCRSLPYRILRIRILSGRLFSEGPSGAGAIRPAGHRQQQRQDKKETGPRQTL